MASIFTQHLHIQSHQQAPPFLPSMYIKLQSLFHHAVSHCYALPQMCPSSIVSFFFLAVVSSTQRWFETSTSPVTHAKVQECWISLSWSSLAPTLFPITHSTLVPVTTLLSLHHVAGIPNSGRAQPLPSLTRKPSADFDQAHSSVTSKYLSSGGASPTSSSWISYLFSSHFLLPSFFFIIYLPQHDLMYLLFKSPSWNISSTKVEN